MENVDRVYNVSTMEDYFKRDCMLNISGRVLFHATMIRIFQLSIILRSSEAYIN